MMVTFLVVNLSKVRCNGKKEQIWEQDLGDTFKIDASTQGLQKVHLKCGANSMHVELETEENFTGVMYTRGSFYKQTAPCFVKAKPGKASRSLKMNFPIDQCQTIQEGDVYRNVVVVQHDPDLVTPGDAAFALECDFRTPRSVSVSANIQARDGDREAIGSRITLASPDPSATDTTNEIDSEFTVFNNSHSVTFTPSTTSKSHKKAQLVKGTVESVHVHRELNDEL